MENKFKVGDKVRLISGGPEMMVDCLILEGFLTTKPYYNGRVKTKWFNGESVESGEFNQSTLVIIV